MITEKAASGLALLSGGAGTEADTYVNENEAPQFAVDGDVTKSGAQREALLTRSLWI